MLARIVYLVKRYYLKYIIRECISGVLKGYGFDGKIDFYISEIGPNREFIAVKIPECYSPFTQVEIWIHEFVEHTIGNLLLYSSKRVRFGSMRFALPFKHFITCLSTYSGAEMQNENGIYCWSITPDQFIEAVGLTDIRF